MARPRKDAPIDLSEAQELTAGLIERLTCRIDIKAQAFLRDSIAPGLRVRVSNTGAKAFVFEAKLNRQTIRRTIGDVRAWTIDAARKEVNRLRLTLDAGTDPRELERQKEAARAASKAAAAVQALTVGEVWSLYLAERQPHWGERHYRDHKNMAAAGGVKKSRGTRTGKGLTIPGPIHPLLALKLSELTPSVGHKRSQDPPNVWPPCMALPEGVSYLVRRTKGISAPAACQPSQDQESPGGFRQAFR